MVKKRDYERKGLDEIKQGWEYLFSLDVGNLGEYGQLVKKGK